MIFVGGSLDSRGRIVQSGREFRAALALALAPTQSHGAWPDRQRSRGPALPKDETDLGAILVRDSTPWQGMPHSMGASRALQIGAGRRLQLAPVRLGPDLTFRAYGGRASDDA